jgi:CheY-like chemotaxis protein
MKPQIFIVDDNEMMREFLSSYFGQEYDVTSFDSAEDVLSSLTPGFKPDLIIADYSMEGLDGLALLRNLKTSGYYQDIPVVFVSGQQKSDTRIQCLEEGAEDFVTKPFNPQELALKVKRILATKVALS